MNVSNRGLSDRRFAATITRIVLFLLLLVSAGGFSSAALAAADDYKLSPGDILTFDLLDDADLPVTLTVASNGDVQFPLVGDVRIANLTISEALAKLRGEYISREILKDPKIALNVTTFRPVFVLGEVKTPGSFAYFAGLTVEQAIGLAGGIQTAATNASDRVMARARLRGAMDGADVEIAQEAVYAARLVAQLAGRDKVDLKDVPDFAKNFVQADSLRPVIEIEQKILDTDLKTSKSQVEILSQGIVEAEGGMKILDQLVAQQKEVVELNNQDLERVQSLRQRQLNTVSELLRAKSAASNEKARLLDIYAEMSRSRRELGSLRLELAKLQADRVKNILQLLQERGIAIKKLIAARRSAEEQFFLMATVAADESKKNEITYSYQIRREVDGKREAITANTLTAVLPGDVVLVSVAGI
jgi:protein involved in polysaccharide export with SLBB domain